MRQSARIILVTEAMILLCTLCHLSITLHIKILCFRINGNDTCTEILLEALGDKIVNLTDGKGR